MLTIEPHPSLDLQAFVAKLPRPLGEIASSPDLLALLELNAPAPLERSEELRKAVRDLLRHGGYKPTGRGKPASEYLVRAAGEGGLSAINLLVDACNAASLHSGLPISVVDVDLSEEPLTVGIAAMGSTYVFNASGQEIDASGLLCLQDAAGPCANAVKDSQRTKTHAGTERALCLVWGTNEAPGVSERTAAWYRELLEQAGVDTETVTD
jgi:DNA/RNA-binding domain of Phe-tRNA-synthetase-like protein